MIISNKFLPVFLLKSFIISVVTVINVFAFTGVDLDSTYGSFTATRWAGNQQSAFSFTFDDGLRSQYDNAFPILTQYGMIGTFYVLPPYLADSLPGVIWRYGTWPMFDEMNINGNEIGSHSMNHLHMKTLDVGDPNTQGTMHYELYQSQQMINNRFGNSDCITFAYPYGEHNNLIDSLTAIYYESARAIGSDPNPYMIEENQFFALNSYPVTFSQPRNTPDDDLDELNSFENWISTSIDSGTWAVQQIHEVVPFDSLSGLISSGSYEPITNEWFSLLCDWLYQKREEGSVWIETVANITKYIKERDSYQYQLISVNDQQIQLQLSDSLDNSIYNYPLSGLVKIPGNWQPVYFQQENRIETLEPFVLGNDTLVVANIVPDGGVAALSKNYPNFVENETFEPYSFTLYQNYPNPFNSTTKIKFTISGKAENYSAPYFVSLKVYNILGNEIATLVNETKSSGNYEINFNAIGLASGMYFYTLKVGNYSETKKLILLK